MRVTSYKTYPERAVMKAIQQAFSYKYHVLLIHVDAGAAGMRRGQDRNKGGYSGIPIGYPDLVGVYPIGGRAVYIEVKAPGKKPSKQQSYMLDFLQSQGAIAFWADSVDEAFRKFENQL